MGYEHADDLHYVPYLQVPGTVLAIRIPWVMSVLASMLFWAHFKMSLSFDVVLYPGFTET
jgi:hypothetical protein